MRNGKGSPAFARGKDRGRNSSGATGSTPPFPHLTNLTPVLVFLCQGEKVRKKGWFKRKSGAHKRWGGHKNMIREKERQESD